MYDIPDNKPMDPNLYNNKNGSKINNTYYATKLRVAVVAFVLFLLFSQNVAYKILDIVVQLFNNRIQVIDEDENPLFIGTFIMGVILALIIFFI
jgi:hypothetical protein